MRAGKLAGNELVVVGNPMDLTQAAETPKEVPQRQRDRLRPVSSPLVPKHATSVTVSRPLSSLQGVL